MLQKVSSKSFTLRTLLKTTPCTCLLVVETSRNMKSFTEVIFIGFLFPCVDFFAVSFFPTQNDRSNAGLKVIVIDLYSLFPFMSGMCFLFLRVERNVKKVRIVVRNLRDIIPFVKQFK